MEKKLKLILSNYDKKLQHMYWISKLRKYPTALGFIIAEPKYSVKPLSKALISTTNYSLIKLKLIIINVLFSLV